MCGKTSVSVRGIMCIAGHGHHSALHLSARAWYTYGPSVQVKTCPKPHEWTSLSASARDVIVSKAGDSDDGMSSTEIEDVDKDKLFAFDDV